MNNTVDEKRLGQAVETLAATIIEIIEPKFRHFAEESNLLQPDHLAKQRKPESGGELTRRQRQST